MENGFEVVTVVTAHGPGTTRLEKAQCRCTYSSAVELGFLAVTTPPAAVTTSKWQIRHIGGNRLNGKYEDSFIVRFEN